MNSSDSRIQARGAPRGDANQDKDADIVNNSQVRPDADVQLKRYETPFVHFIRCDICDKWRQCSPEDADVYSGDFEWICSDKRSWVFSSENSCEDACICDLIHDFLSPETSQDESAGKKSKSRTKRKASHLHAREPSDKMLRALDVTLKIAKEEHPCVDISYLFLAIRSFGSLRTALMHDQAMHQLVAKLGLTGARPHLLVKALTKFYQSLFARKGDQKRHGNRTLEMYLMQQDAVRETITRHQARILQELGVPQEKTKALQQVLEARDTVVRAMCSGDSLESLVDENAALHRSEGVTEVMSYGAGKLRCMVDVFSSSKDTGHAKIAGILESLAITADKESQFDQKERNILVLMGMSDAGKSSSEDWYLRCSAPNRYT
jgi:hypothetical protein